MKQGFKFALSGIVALSVVQACTQPEDILKKCWERQVKPLTNKHLALAFSENRNELEHSFKPWQETNYFSVGTVWCNADIFLKTDSLEFNGRKYNSRTQLNLNDSSLLHFDYGTKSYLQQQKACTKIKYLRRFGTHRFS
jgi:hypothetical protein